MDAPRQGQVRVGTRKKAKGKQVDPSFPGFTAIVCLTPSTKYGMLGPYCLKVKMKFSAAQFPMSSGCPPPDPRDAPPVEEYECLMEDAWQFSKVYPTVARVEETQSQWDRTIIWSWPPETHCLVVPQPNGQPPVYTIQLNYFAWRKAGMTAKYPIRYPPGKRHMNECLFSLAQLPDGTVDPHPLSYIEARKAIYLPYYVGAVKLHPEFIKLRERLIRGENLLIIEVDGPQARSMPHYKQTYGVGDDFIENDTIVINAQRLDCLLNDPVEKFGHGYALAGALLGIY